MANVLKSILLDELVVWCYYDVDENLRYIITTHIQEDHIMITRDLLIYTFTGLGETVPSELVRGFEVIKKYAKAEDCELILAYVEDPRIKRFLEYIGASLNYSLMQLEVK